MLSDVSVVVFGDREVHDAARVRIERADLLRRAGVSDLLHQELRHLPQLGVLALAEAERVDDVVPIAARVAAERGVDDDLQRVERLALAPEQRVGAVAGQVQPDVVRRLFDGRPRASRPIAPVTCVTKSMTWASRSLLMTGPVRVGLTVDLALDFATAGRARRGRCMRFVTSTAGRSPAGCSRASRSRGRSATQRNMNGEDDRHQQEDLLLHRIGRRRHHLLLPEHRRRPSGSA